MGSRNDTEGTALSTDLPTAVDELCRAAVGRVLTTERLGGMSGAGVHRVRGTNGTVVVKSGVGGRELGVYTRLAPVLADAGIRIPRCLGAHTGEHLSWLVLEDLPIALPRERWGADVDVLDTLRRLHSLSPDVLAAEVDPFRPRWDDAMTVTAATRLGLSTTARRTLEAGLPAAHSLFACGTVISGDPNPLNWGIAGDDRVTLMDWDRIGLGHPAIDLAIALPGLPSAEEASRMVAAYGAPESGSGSPEISSADVLLAKAWTVVEFVDEAVRDELAHEQAWRDGLDTRTVVDTLTGSFEKWLVSVAAQVSR